MGLFTKFLSVGDRVKFELTRPRELPLIRSGYDENLIPKLKNDHKLLVESLSKMQYVARNGDYVVLSARLNEFKRILLAHLAVEDAKFYDYLEQHLSHDISAKTMISKFRAEMDAIAAECIKFLKYYDAIKLNSEIVAKLLIDLNVISATLMKRISAEESKLYTLYMPSYDKVEI